MSFYILLAVLLCTCNGWRTCQGVRVQKEQAAAEDVGHDVGHVAPSMMRPWQTQSTTVHVPPKVPPTTKRRHPFPSFQLSDVQLVPSIVCSCALFLAGVVCSAGGLGGGGIYVTVLMVAGQLSPHDAVPISKATVFIGAMSAFALNIVKSTTRATGEKKAKPLIDFNICRLVVPSSLIGTLMGVMLNNQVPPWFIVALLCTILIAVTFMSARTCWVQYWREISESSDPGSEHDDQGPAGDAARTCEDGQNAGCKDQALLQMPLLQYEVFGSALLLFLIVVSGTLRGHANACYLGVNDPYEPLVPETCKAPVITAVFGQTFLSGVMSNNSAAKAVLMVCLLVPFLACAVVAVGYGRFFVTRGVFDAGHVFKYCGMALCGGCFAGMVGIGGGMIFAPFFLAMGIEPSTAVATSSTCVIFTSSSTTFQFLLQDRISISLSLVYGLVNAAASYVGTSLVHILQDKWQARKSFISGFVVVGVLASVALSLYKLMTMGVEEATAG